MSPHNVKRTFQRMQFSFLILLVALLLLALLMFALPLPEKDSRLHGYMLSRWFLAVSYIALAVYCYFKSRIPLELVSPVFLFMANLQANLLALSHVNLINPRLVNRRFVLLHFLPLIAFALAYALLRLFSPHVPLGSYSALCRNILQPEVILRLLWMMAYIVAVVYYITMFAREEKRWKQHASDFYADDSMIDIFPIHNSFVLISFIGLTTFVVSLNVLPLISAVCNISFLVLYIIVGLIFLRYPYLFTRMKQMLYQTDFPQAGQQTVDNIKWEKIRTLIVDTRLFCRRGVTMEQIAREAGVSRTALSTLINKQEGVNFNTFINRLRIQEAQRLMREQPDLTMQEISDRIGYSEQSNFSRHFKAVSSYTPQQWHAKYCLSFDSRNAL